jgi:hypothetical protein
MMWRSAILAGVRAIARREIEAAPAYREDGEFPPNKVVFRLVAGGFSAAVDGDRHDHPSPDPGRPSPSRLVSEEADGTIRLTRPLTSHLAMTAAIWRPVAQAVVGWLARALAGSLGAERRLPSPLPALPAPKRTWQGLEPPVARTCHECGRCWPSGNGNFCSEACTVSFHVATTTAAELVALPAHRAPSGSPTEGGGLSRGVAEKNRRHLALRRAWDAEHTPGEGLSRTPKERVGDKATGEQLRRWFTTTLVPIVAKRPFAEIRSATGLSTRYAIMIRQGHIPHPRHYPALAHLAGVPMPPGSV